MVNSNDSRYQVNNERHEVIGFKDLGVGIELEAIQILKRHSNILNIQIKYQQNISSNSIFKIVNHLQTIILHDLKYFSCLKILSFHFSLYFIKNTSVITVMRVKIRFLPWRHSRDINHSSGQVSEAEAVYSTKETAFLYTLASIHFPNFIVFLFVCFDLCYLFYFFWSVLFCIVF